MTVLAIETATAVCATAVIVNGKVSSEYSLNTPHIHSEKLMSLIDDSLRSSSVGSDSCDGIAVSIGPGSFTGLRIGLSCAKGLSCAWNKPIVPVPTLEALALNAATQNGFSQHSVILAAIDARRNEVYAAGYRSRNDELEEVIPLRSILLEEISDLLRAEHSVVVTGDGVRKIREFIEGSNSGHDVRCLYTPEEWSECRASSVGLLGELRLKRGFVAEVASLEPLYVKDFHTLVNTQHSSAR